MFRKLVLGFAAAAALGAGLFSMTAPAAAQSWSITIGSGQREAYPARGLYQPVGQGWSQHDGWGRGGGWGQGGGWGRGWDRPRHPHWGGGHGFYQGGPRCFVRKVRFWDGWGWTVERRRVCH